MTYNDDKIRSKDRFSFLQNGKPHFSNKVGDTQSATDQKQGAEGVFGKPLKDAFCGSTTECGKTLTVPEPVIRCFQEIIKRGLETEGVFRLSGGRPIVERLQLDFDRQPASGNPVDLKNEDIHDIANVVKKYLRLLPDPVIPKSNRDDFIRLFEGAMSDNTAIIAVAAFMRNKLPKEHFDLIHYIIFMASKIQQHVGINKMDPEALATVLAPACTGFEEVPKQSSFFGLLPQSNNSKNLDQLKAANDRCIRPWEFMIKHSDALLKKWSVPTVPNHQSSPTLFPHPQNPQSEDLAPLKQTDERYKVVAMRSR